MSSQAIGNLFVQLGLDSAQFQQGLRQTQSNMSRFGREMAKVSAGIAAAGTAAFAAFTNSAGRLGDLQQQAKMAGLSGQEFKVAALAVEQYGVSQEKLSDILKDVNDKFGDFAATGGGELKDFFENIAPKVGVTIDSFRNLSSSDALALYVSSLEKANVSQQEMTFYMEALANDATALVPAFRNGGAAIEEMRKRAEELGLSVDDNLGAVSRKVQSDMRAVSEVLRTDFDQAVVQMAPQLQKLTQAMIPVAEGLTRVAQGVLEWTDILGKGSRAFVDRFIEGMRLLPNSASTSIAALAAGIAAGMSTIAHQALDYAKQIVANVIEGLKGLYEAGVQAVKDLAAGMAAEFVALKDRALGWGRDIADGLKSGLDAAKDRVRGAVSSVADTIKGVFTDEMEIQSPSRVFMRFGGFITEGLQKGIEAGGSGVQGAMQDMAAGVSGVFQAVLFEGASFKDSMKQMLGNLFSGWGSNLFQQGISGLGKAIGLPFFARGGFHSGGLRIVGENGPELEATGPARYFSASQTRRMMGDGLGSAQITVNVEGANGDQHIVDLVKQGVRQGIDQYDKHLPKRLPNAMREAQDRYR